MNTFPKSGLLSATTIIGDTVRNKSGDNLGKIEDLMLDLEYGNIAYAVLSFGGFMGMGNKLFAIPWKALTLDAEEKEFVLNVAKESLEDAPGFDKDQWPEMSHEWGAQVHDYYGVNPYWR
jgi:sporulation protein YlmC with PRC-barrel domain